MSSFVTQTYDAMVLLAYGIDLLLKNGEDVLGPNLLEVIRTQVEVEGASGLLNMSESLTGFGRTKATDIVSSQHYRIVNFNADIYNEDENSSLVAALDWSLDGGVQSCPSTADCMARLVLNTIDNKPALEKDPDIILEVPLGQKALLIVVAVLVWTAVLGFTCFIFIHRNAKIIKYSQPVMLYIILAGNGLAGCRVFLGSLSLSNRNCTSSVWLGHLSFVLVFGALFVKTWRIHRLVNNKKITRVTITDRDILKVMMKWLFAAILFLIMLTVFGKPELSYSSSTVSNRTSKVPLCKMHRIELETALFVVEAVVLIFGARLCWAVREVPDSVNESKFIAAGELFCWMFLS
jgi:hypothetical protein